MFHNHQRHHCSQGLEGYDEEGGGERGQRWLNHSLERKIHFFLDISFFSNARI